MSAARDRWAAVAGRELEAVDPEGAVRTLRLEEVTEVLVAGRWASFTLRFRGGADFPAGQRTYQLVADDLAEPVFVVPVGRDGADLLLEAVFSQAAEEAP